MQSKSNRFPNGMGNDSGELGHNIMDHHFQTGARGTFDGFKNKTTYGRKPAGFFIPRFRNIGGITNRKDFIRGYGYQGGARRGSMSIANSKEELAAVYGKKFKEIIQAYFLLEYSIRTIPIIIKGILSHWPVDKIPRVSSSPP